MLSSLAYLSSDPCSRQVDVLYSQITNRRRVEQPLLSQLALNQDTAQSKGAFLHLIVSK